MATSKEFDFAGRKLRIRLMDDPAYNSIDIIVDDDLVCAVELGKKPVVMVYSPTQENPIEQIGILENASKANSESVS